MRTHQLAWRLLLQATGDALNPGLGVHGDQVDETGREDALRRMWSLVDVVGDVLYGLDAEHCQPPVVPYADHRPAELGD